MRNKLLVVILIFYNNCCVGQIQKNNHNWCDTFDYTTMTYEQLLKYIEDPCPNDTTCKNEISKAKAEVDAGRTTFCMPAGLGYIELRQEQQLTGICRSNGLNFSYELTYCVVQRG
jgi:hypothetical protein